MSGVGSVIHFLAALARADVAPIGLRHQLPSGFESGFLIGLISGVLGALVLLKVWKSVRGK